MEAAKFLIENGANVSIPDNAGYTPLMWALYHYDKKAIKTLIDHGANINDQLPEDLIWQNIGDGRGISNEELEEELQHSGNTALMEALHIRDLDMIVFLIEHGIDHSIQNDNGLTAMRIAQNKFQRASAYLAYKQAQSNNRVGQFLQKKSNRFLLTTILLERSLVKEFEYLNKEFSLLYPLGNMPFSLCPECNLSMVGFLLSKIIDPQRARLEAFYILGKNTRQLSQQRRNLLKIPRKHYRDAKKEDDLEYISFVRSVFNYTKVMIVLNQKKSPFIADIIPRIAEFS
jgi:hypothetical protein